VVKKRLVGVGSRRGDDTPEVEAWPSSLVAQRAEARASARAKTVSLALLRTHAGRQVAAGWRGAAAVAALAYVLTRVGVAALVRVAARCSVAAFGRVLPTPVTVGLAAAAAAVATAAGRELSALGASLSNVGEELTDSSSGSKGDAQGGGGATGGAAA
jgi:hypothetical protein